MNVTHKNTSHLGASKDTAMSNITTGTYYRPKLESFGKLLTMSYTSAGTVIIRGDFNITRR